MDGWMDGSSCCADAVTEPFPKPRGLPRRAEERLPSVEETPGKETVGSTPHNHCIHPSSLHNQQPAPREGFRSSLQEESVSTGGPEAAKAGDDSVKVLEAETPGLPPRGKHRPPPALPGLQTIFGRTGMLPAPEGSRPGTEYVSGHSWHEDEDREGQGASAVNSQTSDFYNTRQKPRGG